MIPRAGVIPALGWLVLAVSALALDAQPLVLNGIDVLQRRNYSSLAGKRLGLVTNHTGLAADGRTTIDLLSGSGVCELVALFSPEHGIRGLQDSRIPSSRDEVTGLPIYSLYGETLRPAPEALRGLDALVFDIQDIGARFYTYATTMAYCMEEAAKAGISFYVLDRPNPIGGLAVEAPMLDADKTSFTGYMPMPVRHGMTVGEMAKYFNRENRIGVDLHVVEMVGWKRDYYFDETGQVWVHPSPNMRSLVAAIFYPGVCLLEPANVSVGRGTERPFELFGAPWVEPIRLAAKLNASGLPGVRFVPTYFTPSSSKFQGAKCGGVSLVLTDRSRFKPVLTGLTLISALHNLFPGKFEIDKVIRLLGNEEALEALKAGRSPLSVYEAAAAKTAEFLARRRQSLIYGRSGTGVERKR